MPDVLLFVVLSLATFRLWRLIGKDDISAGIRAKLPAVVAKPVSCPWCSGSWLSIAATFAVDRWLVFLDPWWPLWAAGVAAVVGFLGEMDRELDSE